MAKCSFRNCFFSLCFISMTMYIGWSLSKDGFDINRGFESSNRSFNYVTSVSNTTGKTFTFNHRIPIREPSYFINLSNYDMKNFTFVTAADRNHYNESKDAVAGFQQLFPEHRIIYYDLGLEIEEVETIKEWCNVEYRRLDYDIYPPHIHQHQTYGFKAVILYNMLQELEAIFWIDSSIRPKDTNITRWTQVFDVARKSGIVLFDHTGQAITNYTHPQMFDYLPANVNKLEEIQMLGSCVILIYRTQKVYREIIHWDYLCALTPACITPPGHTVHCTEMMSNNRFCHRYDQSSLAILINNYAAYNISLYIGPTEFIAVYRFPTDNFQLQICHKNSIS